MRRYSPFVRAFHDLHGGDAEVVDITPRRGQTSAPVAVGGGTQIAIVALLAIGAGFAAIVAAGFVFLAILFVAASFGLIS